MYKFSSKFFYFNLVAILILAFSIPLFSQTINVQFRVNTSTNPDTLMEDHFVQVRGAVNGATGAILPDGSNISWDNASDLVATNVGGDYWELDFQMNTGDTLRYKFWAGFNDSTGTFHNTGWEDGLVPTNGLDGDNRGFIAGATDTTVDLQYFNGTGETKDQMWAPFETKADSVAIYFRVNMAGVMEAEQFDPAVNGPVGVRGDPATSGGAIDWGETRLLLELEPVSADSSMWSGAMYVPKDSVSTGLVQNYKFYATNTSGLDWEADIDNRTFGYPEGLEDSTIHWVYFNNVEPVGETPVESQVTFRVSTEALNNIGLFDRSLDEIKVIGAKGWSRPDDYIDMNFNSLLVEWTAVEQFNVIPGTVVNYKYFIVWDSSRVDTTSDNYIPALSLDNGWEEPAVTGGGNRTWTYQDQAQQSPPGDFGFDRQFFASVPPEGSIDKNMQVTFNINMEPATNAATNTMDLFDPAQDTVYVQWDGELNGVTQGYEVGERFLMLEDPDDDMVYSGTFNMQAPFWYQFGFVITYVKPNGSAFTNGGGFERGRRYYQYIRPIEVNQDLEATYPDSYNFPVLDWMESDLTVEDPPDLTQPSAIEGPGNVPHQFALDQNYPNPFNPSTTIRYELAKTTDVEVMVYNVRGQLVKTLVNTTQNPGEHTAVWNGVNESGNRVASGIYFIRMKADEFNKVRKMTLLR